MPGLHELQRDFTRSVRFGDNLPSDWLRANGISPDRRLAVYRNNTVLGLVVALRDAYPVVNRLVGDAFFDAMARQFIFRHPPGSSCLFDYGVGFPGFLANYRPAQGLPYLADVASLERLRQEAFHETDAAGLDLSALAAVPEEAYGELRLRLHPSARQMVSDYPVLRIWEVNQPGFAGDDRVNLQEGCCRLLVFRPGLDVEVLGLKAGDDALLRTLAQDGTLNEAVDQAMNADSHFDLFSRLDHWIRRNLFTHFSY